jgi:hypothetical protein
MKEGSEMRCFALTAAAILLFGSASPVQAQLEEVLNYKYFYVEVSDGQDVIDTGLFAFTRHKPKNQCWQNKLETAWFFRGTFPGADYEVTDWQRIRDGFIFDWEGWYEYDHSPEPPYDDIEGCYVIFDDGREFICGRIEPLNEDTEYYFFGESFHW